MALHRQSKEEIESKICSRCKKNKATMQYAESVMDFTHGFVENICDECYEKQKKANPWYKSGREDMLKEVEKAIDECDCDKEYKIKVIDLKTKLGILKHLTNTQELSLCNSCGCATWILMDDDGNRFCGKCKEPKPNINIPVYNKLKEIAKRQETITYSQFASDCNISYTSIEERNEFHHLIGNISKNEVKNSRPMLSVLIHHKGDLERTPGKGFFELADELNQRKEKETDKQLQYRMIKECWNFWKEKEL
jgi:hypothetical protein